MTRRKPPGGGNRGGGNADGGNRGGDHHDGNGGDGGGGNGPDIPPAVRGPLQHAIPGLKKPTPHGQGGGGQPPGRGRPPGGRPGGQQPGGDPMHPVTPGWRRVDAQHVPQHVRDAAQGYQPRVSGQPRHTTAAYDNRTLTSGGDQRHLADDIAYERIPREGGRPYPQAPNVLYQHPEMQVAADMRRRGLTSTEVVVDNSMCGTRGFDSGYALTCDKLLPQVMPNGSQMSVWATTDGGKTFFHRVVTGTGNLIRP